MENDNISLPSVTVILKDGKGNEKTLEFEYVMLAGITKDSEEKVNDEVTKISTRVVEYGHSNKSARAIAQKSLIEGIDMRGILLSELLTEEIESRTTDESEEI